MSDDSANPDRIYPADVIAGYRAGYFPMSGGRKGRIDWFIAEPRTVLPLDERFRVRRSLRQSMKRLDYQIRINFDFPTVIRACARHGEVSDREVWLSDELIELYCELHRQGIAHSVEVWTADGLVGGLYGIALQRAFFGESMFSRIPSASQIALVALVERLRLRGFNLLDVQTHTPHLGFFGAIDLTHLQSLELLHGAMNGESRFAD